MKVALLAVIAIVLLYFSFRGIKWSDFVEGLKTADYFWIVLSVFLGFASFYIRAARWRIMLLGFGKPVRRVDTVDGIGMMYLTNFAIPRAGEIARCGVVARSTGLGFNAVLGSVVAERAFDVLCLLIVTFIVAFARIDIFGNFMVTQIWQPFIGSLGGNIWLAVLLCVAVVAVVVLPVCLSRKVADFCKGIWKGLVDCFKMPHKGTFLLLTLLMWASFVATSYCTILATPMRDQLDLVDALFLMVVGSFGWVVPVQGGIGAFHFIVSLALVVVYGITQTSGMVFATISHESQAVAMLLFGLFAIIHLSVDKKRRAAMQTDSCTTDQSR